MQTTRKEKRPERLKMVGLECSVEEHSLAGPSQIIKQPATALRSKETRLSAASRSTCISGTRNAKAKSAREMESKTGPKSPIRQSVNTRLKNDAPG